MQPGNGLTESDSFGGPEGDIKFGLLLSSQQCSWADADGPRRLFGIAVRKQGNDRFFLFPPEFCPVALHLRSPAIICRFFNLTLHRHLSAFAPAKSPCISSQPE